MNPPNSSSLPCVQFGGDIVGVVVAELLDAAFGVVGAGDVDVGVRAALLPVASFDARFRLNVNMKSKLLLFSAERLVAAPCVAGESRACATQKKNASAQTYRRRRRVN